LLESILRREAVTSSSDTQSESSRGTESSKTMSAFARSPVKHRMEEFRFGQPTTPRRTLESP